MYGFRGKGEGKGGNDITLLLVLLGIYIYARLVWAYIVTLDRLTFVYCCVVIHVST